MLTKPTLSARLSDAGLLLAHFCRLRRLPPRSDPGLPYNFGQPELKELRKRLDRLEGRLLYAPDGFRQVWYDIRFAKALVCGLDLRDPEYHAAWHRLCVTVGKQKARIVRHFLLLLLHGMIEYLVDVESEVAEHGALDLGNLPWVGDINPIDPFRWMELQRRFQLHASAFQKLAASLLAWHVHSGRVETLWIDLHLVRRAMHEQMVIDWEDERKFAFSHPIVGERPTERDFGYYVPPQPEEGRGIIEMDKNFIGGVDTREILIRMWCRDMEDWFRTPEAAVELANDKERRKRRAEYEVVVTSQTEEPVSLWERVADKRRTSPHIPYYLPDYQP